MAGLSDLEIAPPNLPRHEFSPVGFIVYSVAGLGFLILSLQVLFPKIEIPFFHLLFSACSLVDFISHEMGHVLAGFLGKFLGVLGGTLSQVFLPVACLILTIKRKQSFLMALFSFWIGENLIQISAYIRDARTQSLKLFSPGAIFGGQNPIHDWNYLLGQTGLLWADQFIGWTVWFLGFSLLVLAILMMFARATGYSVGKSQ